MLDRERWPDMAQLLRPQKAGQTGDVEEFLKQIETQTGIDVLARYTHPKGRKPEWKSNRLRVEWDEGQFTLGRAAAFRRNIKPVIEFSAAEIGSFEIIQVPDDHLSPFGHIAQISLAVSLTLGIVEQALDKPGYLGWVVALIVCTIYLIAVAASRRTLAPAIRLNLSGPSSEHTWVELRKGDFSLTTYAKETRKLAERIAETLEKCGFRGGIPSELTYDPIWKVNRVPAYVRSGLVLGLIVINVGIDLIPIIGQTISGWIERLFP